MAFPKFQTKEVLNKVLNSGEDALKVDIDNVTLNTESSTVSLEVDLDHGTDDVLIYANTNKSGSGTSYVPLVDSDGHLQVDTMSSALPSGAATAANQSTIISHVDGIETLITSSNTKLDTLETTLSNIETAVQIIDDWDDSNYANVNLNLAGSDAPTGGGAESGALRVTIANDSTGVVSVDDGGSTISVDDGGGALTVDGTVTANLSATDNAVLDNIDTSTSSSNTHLSNLFYDTVVSVTPHDSNPISAGPVTYYGLWVGTGGNVKVTLAGSGTQIFNNVASGQLLPIVVTHVFSTDTTASNILALR